MVPQHDIKGQSPYWAKKECNAQMGQRRRHHIQSCQRRMQSLWHIYKRDAWRRKLPMTPWCIHVSCLCLPQKPLCHYTSHLGLHFVQPHDNCTNGSLYSAHKTGDSQGSPLKFLIPHFRSPLMSVKCRTPYSLVHQCVQQDTMSNCMGGVEVQYSYGFLLTYIST